jgi:hypothetical protein
LRRLPAAAALLPIQALGELYNVLIRKAGYTTADARARLVGWSMSYPTADTTRSGFESPRSNLLNGLQPNSRQPAKLGKQRGSNETEFGSLSPSDSQAFGLLDHQVNGRPL